MFCGKCGAENVDGARFCCGCGEPLSVEETPVAVEEVPAANDDYNPASNDDYDQVANDDYAGYGQVANDDYAGYGNQTPKRVAPGKPNMGPKKKMSNKSIGIIAAVAAAVVVIGIVVALILNAAPTINLNDYLTIEAEGYDTRGTAKATIDWDAIEEKYGEKLKFTKAAKKELGAMESLVHPMDAVRESVKVKISENSNLSNGDVIEYTWDYDEELTKYVKCKVKFEDGEYTVSGLEEIQVFDPFDGVKVAFTGMAPKGVAQVETYPDDNGLRYYIQTDDNFHLTNGDVVTVYVDYGWSSEDSYITQYGKIPSPLSKEYTVEGLEEYVSDYSDIDASLIASMKSEAEDAIYSYAASRYGNWGNLDKLEYAGYIFSGTRSDQNYVFIDNMLHVIYKGTVSSPEGDFETVDVYFPFEFRNIIKNSEGVYYEQKYDVVGSSAFSNGYGTAGYMNPLIAYNEIAVYNQDKFNVQCGDGFEAYSEYTSIAKRSDIDDAYVSELGEKATGIVTGYIEKEYIDDVHVEDLAVKGEYVLVAKEQENDFAKNNRMIVVVSGILVSDKGDFDPVEILYPVEFDGIVKLPNEWLYTKSAGIIGYNSIPDTWLYTKGYVDGASMYNDLVTANRDRYTYEVSEGLKEFGE